MLNILKEIFLFFDTPNIVKRLRFRDFDFRGISIRITHCPLENGNLVLDFL